jgi:hypothetical protein
MSSFLSVQTNVTSHPATFLIPRRELRFPYSRLDRLAPTVLLWMASENANSDSRSRNIFL